MLGLERRDVDKRRDKVKYVAQLLKRLPPAAIGRKSPIEVWLGKVVNDYDSLRFFGCLTIM